MGAIEHLTIAITTEAAERMRARVAVGDYLDESAVVEEALAALEVQDDEIASVLPAIDEDDDEQWIRANVVAALDAYERDPSNVLTIEEVRESLAAARQARAVG